MNDLILLFIILVPFTSGLVLLALPKKAHGMALVSGCAVNLLLVILCYKGEKSLLLPFAGFGIDFALKLNHFSGFIILSAAVITLLIAIYTACFAKGKGYTRLLYACMLFTLALANGSVLANNLVLLLFFWEGILATMYVMILIGKKEAYKAALKAILIAGVTDLIMMLGIALTGYLAGTMEMDKIRLPIEGLGLIAFICLMIGALSKAGAFPFHTWIPDAADNAPLPFMAFLPGALEKLLGVYLMTRITMDLFDFQHGSMASIVITALGAATIIIGAMMALIQRDFKRLLSYHAVSQVGYIILGMGTALPVGIIGALFHMLNNAAYKCCLFLTAGAVEKQTGTTNLNILGGLRRKMPVTTLCFIIAALAIAGFPMTNGFFSKELILDSALESGSFYFILAAIGAFLTPVSFLKLGHAAFFGKTPKEYDKVTEAPFSMLAPMALLAAFCLALGIFSAPLISHVLTPILGHSAHVGGHTNWLLVGISSALLLLAIFDHMRGFKKTGRAIEAADHFHHAPVLKTIYDLAEKKVFDPYEMSRGWMNAYADICLKINSGISYFYDIVAPRAILSLSGLIKKAHNGRPARYSLWIAAGVAIIALIYYLG